jgi:transcriptional regulator with XRE-family HTH domain
MSLKPRIPAIAEAEPKKRRRSTGPRATELDVIVGRRLRTARKLAKVTQQQLAAVLGVSFQAVQKYENGENRITAPKLFKAAEFLGADIRFFTTAEDSGPPLDRTALADDEIELIRYYRGVTDHRTRLLLRKLTQAIGHTGVDAGGADDKEVFD